MFNTLSIKYKTYLLVMLSVVMALVLFFVSSQGLNSIRSELDDMVFATTIERYTSKLVVEEQKYRLNANGSVYDLVAANQAYDNTMQYMDEMYDILSQEKHNVSLEEKLAEIRLSTNAYRNLYVKGVSILTKLHRVADVLEEEGEAITSEIQEYVEAKRVEIKASLENKTIEKINNGSNVWQHTYMVRLEEERYRLSPDAAILDAFIKDYAFMMSEWSRLKQMSDQTFEHEKLERFNASAKRYEEAMLLWVGLNKQLVQEILPEMRSFSNSIILNAARSAENLIQNVSKKQNNISISLALVTIVTIILGILFGTAIAQSISSAVSAFQSGLLNFFQYLNHQKETIQPIAIRGSGEISVMAAVVNENISTIQKMFERKKDYQQALLEWSKVDYKDDSITISKATELSSRALHVERVGVWLFNDNLTELNCVDMYIHDSNLHEHVGVFTEHKYPEYFKAIRKGGILTVDQARTDSVMLEFLEDHLEPLDIYSVLDVPIVLNNKLIGVIRHEKTGEIKRWKRDEQDFAGSIVNAIALSQEIKKRQQIQEELKAQKRILHHHAHHDSLTGLPNRFLFNDRLNQAMKQAKRNSALIAVLFVDLDHFKAVNDSMGHKIGDELLIEVTRRLKKNIRQADTLARLGGDEFTVILEQVHDTDAVTAVTQNLLDAMDEPIELSGHTLYVTLSIGVAIYPEDGITADELLKNADKAMYKAKGDGRNACQFYTPITRKGSFGHRATEPF